MRVSPAWQLGCISRTSCNSYAAAPQSGQPPIAAEETLNAAFTRSSEIQLEAHWPALKDRGTEVTQTRLQSEQFVLKPRLGCGAHLLKP